MMQLNLLALLVGCAIVVYILINNDNTHLT